MAPVSNPKVEHTKEVRFAVVMYGGVSLAIYINGVAQEFLSLVRSTAEAYEDGGARRSLSGVPIKDADDPNTKARKLKSGEPISDGDDPDTKARKLKGTERVYRKLSYLLSDNDLLEKYRDWLKDNRERHNGKTDLLDDYLINGNGATNEPEPITTGFIVDILSGTSAGGINAIFLAKALANNQSIEKLKQLWVEEGDIGLLINDKKSLAGLRLDNQDPPKSLLNSRRMYLQLLKAFDGMDRAKESRPHYQSPYVKELDLFVTTTDIKGTVLSLQLSDKIVYEKRHRNVLHFKYGTQQEFGQECNHFLRKYNPFLAFAARCTSSFPFAFEPMRLSELDDLIDSFGEKQYKANGSKSELWKPFFKENIDVAFDDKKSNGAGTLDSSADIRERSFGDGGYLDNKPFSYATESLSHRQSVVPVERKLVYIEPSPEHPEDERQDNVPPNVIANAKAALLDLPTYETIREDLQRVLQRNRTFQRISRIVEATNDDLDRNDRYRREDRYKFKSEHWRLMDMALMVQYCGIYFLPYRRLRIASVTDDLTSLVARIKKLDERSDSFVAVRALLRAWRLNHYVENYTKENLELVTAILEDKQPVEAKQPSEETYNAFLDDFDFSYRFRRLNFVLGKIDALLQVAREGPKSQTEPPQSGSDNPRDAAKIINRAGVENSLAFLTYVKCELTEVHKTLRTALRKLQAGPQLSDAAEEKKDQTAKQPAQISRLISRNFEQEIADFYREFENLKLDERQLKFILGIPGDVSDAGAIELSANQGEEFAHLDERTSEQRAARLYKTDARLNELLENIGSKLRSILSSLIIKPTSNHCAQLLNPERDIPEALSSLCTAKADVVASFSSESLKPLRDHLREFYIHFDDYDQVRFPILYQTEFGESAEVDIFRISPEDAPSLIKERGPGADGRQKLAGNALFHFGAFLDRVWRENDIMWGRLDGAERLITALMPDPDNQIVREKLIGEAHLAILIEEMPAATRLQLTGLLTQALIQASSGEPFEAVLKSAVGPLTSPKVKQRLECVMRACLQDDKLLSFVKEHYEVNRDLEPKPLLRSVARATQVTGKIFDDVAKARHIDSKAILWIARAGQLFWGLVEVAVPGSVANLLMFHWLRLLYVIEVLMVIGGVLFGDSHVKTLAWTLLGLTFGVNLAVLILRDVMRGRKAWVRVVGVLIALALLLFTAIGVYELFHLGWREVLVSFGTSVKTWLLNRGLK